MLQQDLILEIDHLITCFLYFYEFYLLLLSLNYIDCNMPD